MRPAARRSRRRRAGHRPFCASARSSKSRGPYRLYAHLRETPILRDEDGTYIVSTYAEIRSLLQDSRVSSEDIPVFKRARTGNPILDFIINPIKDRIIEAHRPLLFRDPPDHGVLRRLIMTQFTT
jgi:cytochrome P450